MARAVVKTSQVVDTNVPVVANGKSEQAPPGLVEKAICAIRDLMNSGIVAIDDGDRILGEYRRNLHLSGEPGVGDSFVRWVHDNSANSECCMRATLHCTDESIQSFDEFPEGLDGVAVDISDRKFIAVANANVPPCPILQAVDFKWWGWRKALASKGITVQFIDPEYAEVRYNEKHKPE